jgi:hypothetical protein
MIPCVILQVPGAIHEVLTLTNTKQTLSGIVVKMRYNLLNDVSVRVIHDQT